MWVFITKVMIQIETKLYKLIILLQLKIYI